MISRDLVLQKEQSVRERDRAEEDHHGVEAEERGVSGIITGVETRVAFSTGSLQWVVSLGHQNPSTK